MQSLGLQVAWLKLGGCDDSVHSRYDHADLKSRVGDAVHRACRQPARDAAVRQTETDAAMAELLALSRRQVLLRLSPWWLGQTWMTGEAMRLEVSTNTKGHGTMGCGLGQILHYLSCSVEVVLCWRLGLRLSQEVLVDGCWDHDFTIQEIVSYRVSN